MSMRTLALYKPLTNEQSPSALSSAGLVPLYEATLLEIPSTNLLAVFFFIHHPFSLALLDLVSSPPLPLPL